MAVVGVATIGREIWLTISSLEPLHGFFCGWQFSFQTAQKNTTASEAEKKLGTEPRDDATTVEDLTNKAKDHVTFACPAM